MAVEQSHSEEVDLEKTDVLPILDGTIYDSDVADDAVRMDSAATGVLLVGGAAQDFTRTGVDLPSLAESVRSVEERIARQNAEFEALTRSYERLRDAESATTARANALAADLAAARTALESEQGRTRDNEKTLAEKSEAIEASRHKAEEALRESERHQAESRTLRESLASREATISKVVHSLGERDAQLTALQQEHAKVVPALEARSKAAVKLEADLRSTREAAAAVSLELKTSQEQAAGLGVQLKRREAEGNAVRSELDVLKAQSSSYLEQLRTRDWRLGFNQNLFRELDAEVGNAKAGQSTLQAERDELQNQLVNLELKYGAQSKAIETLQATAATQTATVAQQSHDLMLTEEAKTKIAAQLATAEAELERLGGELSAREFSLAETQSAAAAEATRTGKLLEETALRESELTAQIARLRTEREAQIEELHVRREGEMQRLESEHAAQIDKMQTDLAAQIAEMQTEQSAQIAEFKAAVQAKEAEVSILMAHLLEARKPLEPIQAEVKRLTEELAAKSAEFDTLTEEHRKMRIALERTRGALEEREFLIRRLERSESNNANVLGRIQTSIERLGASAGAPGATAAPGTEMSAELVRIDGDRTTTHPLVRRTRIGRANGCELQVESSSVSRHHALLLLGPRDAVIEDLNSTNGVVVNGHKVSRHLLADGDAVTIGDVQFRFVVKSASRATEQPPPA
jgi:chromosome segregation ATPase